MLIVKPVDNVLAIKINKYINVVLEEDGEETDRQRHRKRDRQTDRQTERENKT